jgi:hypothetical protein
MGATSPTTWICDAVRRNELVAVVGTGVSMALTGGKVPALSWKGLVRDGFAFGAKKGKITSGQVKAWKPQLESSDLDDLLGAAEFMSRKLDAPDGDLYARWLEHVFSTVKPTNKLLEEALLTLKAAGVPLCTLNYDSLLEHVTGLPAVPLNDIRAVAAWMRRESAGILHLHGLWHVPGSCVLGIRDYEATLHDDVRDLFQRHLGSFRRLLFVGCGDTFADPNLSALIKWLRDRMKAAAPQHYALVTDREMDTRHCDPAWHSFVEPLGYGASHDDLAGFLLEHFQTVRSARRRRASVRRSPSTAVHEKVLQAYRDFLIRDCGQMTIEGVRADMDTAQRRFDLERLFVPLRVVPCLDARRMERCEDTAPVSEDPEPRPFGRVLDEHRRLALLALPGGGKTLLLKRLVVAYANPSRREASRDGLPDLDVTPVLIRCRDWREHIHRPITALLQNLPALTGQVSLAGLSDALLPLFRQGRILLLVDGLDEIHDDALRTTFVDNLEAFLDAYKFTRVVVTSREAGFALVAPSIARFCSRWRVAPLGPYEIEKLCEHWHRLMGGDSAESRSEGKEVARHLLSNMSLHRLAENPLLLTMLLVVKRGAGRLPPDRVSLYGRAVEVLLDTWNIKGHAPLNLKEAVPQLACVAFQLMKEGKQTATEKELLAILDEARERVPKIRRYTKDTPHDFLKRVELRSSLLIEAGHQIEGGHKVPFYQFRHLTFQEYLSAVACVEGHYLDYDKSHSVLTPLAPHLTSEEWKEVVPMAAVLARKQAEPLLSALVRGANAFHKRFEADERFARELGRLPAPVGLLLQCLIEEAEATPDTLTAALNLVALFARGCEESEDWRSLSTGPYGEELLHQAWLLYKSMRWPRHTARMETCARLTTFLRPYGYWSSRQGHAELRRLVGTGDEERIARALFAFVGRHLGHLTFTFHLRKEEMPRELIEPCLFHASEAVWAVAARVWGLEFFRHRNQEPLPSPAVLDRLLELWLSDAWPIARERAGGALASQLGIPRNIWCPSLTAHQIERFETAFETPERWDKRPEACFIAFHSRNLWPDDKIAEMLLGVGVSFVGKKRLIPSSTRAVLEQMGDTGRKHIERALAPVTDDTTGLIRLARAGTRP